MDQDTNSTDELVLAADETRLCASCQAPFTIEPEEIAFYAKIDVPLPTWCSQCRRQRRLAFRNERSLYTGACALCHGAIISMYAPDSPHQVVCLDCWWSDKWDPLASGKEYDFSRPFFEQFNELLKTVPRPPFMQRNSQNAGYANFCVESTDVYLSYSVVESEGIYYSKSTDKSRSLLDCLQATDCESCYENVFCRNNFKCISCAFSDGCSDSWFLYDCVSCQDCVLSSNLRRRQYVIRNKQYTKEAYFEELKKLQLSTTTCFDAARQEFTQLCQTKALHRSANIVQSQDATGDNIAQANKVRDAFDLYDLENASHAMRLFHSKDSLDADFTFNAELVYEYISGGKHLYRAKFNMNALENLKEIEYTDSCGSSSYLFGCIGLRGKQFCILNKQYTREEYEALVPKIIQQMNDLPYVDGLGREYRYGEFFPPDLSPFAYNETIAQEHMSLDKQSALERGFRWKDIEKKHHTVTLSSEELPSDSQTASDHITKEVIGCAHAEDECNEQCTAAFTILESELAFYRELGLPLPQLCPNCRHYQRLAQRNPLQLWERQCRCAGASSEGDDYTNTTAHDHGNEQCLNQFQTSYAPNRPEIVYCEACYQQEIL